MENVFGPYNVRELNKPTMVTDKSVQWIERLHMVGALVRDVRIGKRRQPKVDEIFDQRMPAKAALMISHILPSHMAPPNRPICSPTGAATPAFDLMPTPLDHPAAWVDEHGRP